MGRLGVRSIRKELREWTDGRSVALFIQPKRGHWEKWWQRVCCAKVGYCLHCVGYVVGWHTSMIFDPLHSGGFFSHLRSFAWNLWHVDIWWKIKHRVDKWRRPEYHRQQDRFIRASLQAMMEDCADPMPPPPGFPAERFHGSILGERYFKRVVELLDDDASTPKS